MCTSVLMWKVEVVVNWSSMTLIWLVQWSKHMLGVCYCRVDGDYSWNAVMTTVSNKWVCVCTCICTCVCVCVSKCTYAFLYQAWMHVHSYLVQKSIYISPRAYTYQAIHKYTCYNYDNSHNTLWVELSEVSK